MRSVPQFSEKLVLLLLLYKYKYKYALLLLKNSHFVEKPTTCLPKGSIESKQTNSRANSITEVIKHRSTISHSN